MFAMIELYMPLDLDYFAFIIRIINHPWPCMTITLSTCITAPQVSPIPKIILK